MRVSNRRLELQANRMAPCLKLQMLALVYVSLSQWLNTYDLCNTLRFLHMIYVTRLVSSVIEEVTLV